MHSMTDWDDLRIVLAVSRAGGLSAAARLLGVNHATISRRVAKLEDSLGVQLFVRQPDGLVPTEAGQRVAATAEAMEDARRELDQALETRDRDLSGRLVVTAPLLVLVGPFARVFASFRTRFPDIELDFVTGTGLLDLHRREADVAIRAVDAPEEDLWGRRLTEVRAAIYCTSDYHERAHALVQRDGPLAPLEWIGFIGQAHPPEEIINRFPNAFIAARFNDKPAMIGAARAGMGLVRLPCFIGDLEPGLMRFPDLPLHRYADIWALTHPSLKRVERVRRFIQECAAEARRMRPLFLGEGTGGGEE